MNAPDERSPSQWGPTGSWRRALAATIAASLLVACGGDHDLTGAWQGLGQWTEDPDAHVQASMVLDDDGSGRLELLVEVDHRVSQMTWGIEGDRALLLFDCREEEQYMAPTQCVPTNNDFHSCLVERDGHALACDEGLFRISSSDKMVRFQFTREDAK